MNRRFLKRNRILLIFFVLMIFTSLASFNHSDVNYKNFRVKRTEELKNTVNDTFYGKAKSTLTTINSKEFTDAEVINENIIIQLLSIFKSLQTLFFKLIIILSFYAFFLYIRDWILLISQFGRKFFVMHYLQLKDGKKGALSAQFSL